MFTLLWIASIGLAVIAYLSAGYMLADWSIRTQANEDAKSVSALLMFPLHHFWGELSRHRAAKLDHRVSSDYPGTSHGWYVFIMMTGWPIKVAINSVLLIFLAVPLTLKRYRDRPAKPKPAKPVPAKTAAETYADLMTLLDRTKDGQEPLLEARRLMELRTHVEQRLKNLTAALEEKIEAVNQQLSQVRDLAQPVVLDTDERLYRLLAEEYGQPDVTTSSGNDPETSSGG